MKFYPAKPPNNVKHLAALIRSFSLRMCFSQALHRVLPITVVIRKHWLEWSRGCANCNWSQPITRDGFSPMNWLNWLPTHLRSRKHNEMQDEKKWRRLHFPKNPFVTFSLYHFSTSRQSLYPLLRFAEIENLYSFPNGFSFLRVSRKVKEIKSASKSIIFT